MTNSDYMRKILDTLDTVSESSELTEILGFQTAKKVGTSLAAKAGVSSAKQSLQKSTKVKELLTGLQQSWKSFISGNHNIPSYKNKKQNPKDPKTIEIFLHLVGFDDSDISFILGKLDTSEHNSMAGQLITEFIGSSINNVLHKAAKYAVEHNIQIGQGKSTAIKSKSIDSGKKVNDNKSVEKVGLDNLNSNVVSLIKKISPQAASELELKLVDGFDVTAQQIAGIVNKAPDSAINQLALVGFAYILHSLRSASSKSPALVAPPAKATKKTQPKYTEL